MGLAGWHRRGHERRNPSGGRRRSAGPWAGLAAGLALTGLAIVVVLVTVPRPVDAGEVPQGSVPALGHRAGSPVNLLRPGRSAIAAPTVAALPDPETGPPRRLVVPALHIDARVVPVHRTKGGDLAVPSDPHVLGWWVESAVPGSPVGTAVIDGHVDSAIAGVGALFYLRNLKPGTQLKVTGSQGSLAYTVTGVREYPKDHFPEGQLFTQHVAGRLVIITCGGPFDTATRSYLDNVVAFAVPSGGDHSPRVKNTGSRAELSRRESASLTGGSPGSRALGGGRASRGLPAVAASPLAGRHHASSRPRPAGQDAVQTPGVRPRWLRPAPRVILRSAFRPSRNSALPRVS